MISTHTFWRCEECEEIFDEEPEGPGYECGNCGETYSREMTEGGNHRCPSCNKFGSRACEIGCPSCGCQCEQIEGIKCPHCDALIDEGEVG